VGFLFDTGDEGACLTVSALFEPLLVMFYLATSATLTGWGGSGREGKGYPQLEATVPVAMAGFS
jgi:hypothetical protein